MLPSKKLNGKLANDGLNSFQSQDFSRERDPDTQQLENIKTHLDLLLIALESLTEIGSVAIIEAAKKLDKKSLVSDRVSLWRLRQSNPQRKSSGGRKKLDVEEARTLVLIVCHLAREYHQSIRSACSTLEQNRGMVNAVRLSRMRPGALLINCARGELVDSAAMAEALKAVTIAGYAADVLDQEPPPADHPLLRAPNCVVTPHVGSRTYESVLRQAGMAVDNLLLALKGEKPLAQVNDVPTRAI